MGFLKSKSSTVLTGSLSIETTKKGRGSGGMRKRLGSRDQLRQTPSASSAAARNNTPDSREDQGTEDAARGKTRSRSQQQKKPAAAGNKKKAAGGKSKPEPRQGGQKQQRQKSRSRGRRPSADRSIEYETSYSASYSSRSYDSEDEVTDRTSFGYNSTFESEDEVTEKTSFDSPANRRRLAKSAKRQAEARKARGRSKGASGGRNKLGSTPPPRPESPVVASPVEAAGRALDKLGELINPQPSDAEETNPSTLESGGRSQVIDFVVQNEANQLMIQNAEHGNVEKLHLHEMSYIPTPKTPTDVIVKVQCSTITLQDCMVRRGKWHEKESLPYIPGTDVVGTILALGSYASAHTTFKAGDYVYAMVPSGGNAKYASVPYQDLIRVPEGTDPTVALCIASTYAPVKQSFDLARIKNTPFTGANVLVIGGNGPVGLATIELALYEGACVHATASERHHPYLAALGVQCHPIEPAKWLPKLRGRMDVVFDSVCIDEYASSHEALNSTGTLVCTGFSAVYTRGKIAALNGWVDMRDFRAFLVRFRADYVLDNVVFYDRKERYLAAPNEFAQHFRFLCHLHGRGIITPVVSGRAPLRMVPSVQRNIELGDVPYGVSVCVPWDAGVDAPPADGGERCDKGDEGPGAEF